MSHQHKMHMAMPVIGKQDTYYPLCGQPAGYELHIDGVPSQVTCLKCLSIVKYVSRRVSRDTAWVDDKLKDQPPADVIELAKLRLKVLKLCKKHKRTKNKLAHCRAMLMHEKMFNTNH